MSADHDKLIAEAIKKGGMSRADASVLVDISRHAFEEGVATVTRILDTAPIHLRKAALASVAGSFAGILHEHFPEHWQALMAQPEAVVEPTVIVLPPRKEGQG